MRRSSSFPLGFRSLLPLAAGLALLCGGAVRSQEAPGAEMERNSWRYIVIHHSATPSGNAAQFNRMHRGNGWDGVAYHFVIDNGKGGADGRLEVTERWRSQKHGAHAGALPAGALPEEKNEYNEFGIGICLVGNFQTKPPTAKQLATLSRLVGKLQGMFNIPDEAILGHGHVRGTACPGKKFPWRTLFAQLSLPAPKHLYRRNALATTDLCRWCIEQPETAATAFRPAAATRPGSDLPPRLLLPGGR